MDKLKMISRTPGGVVLLEPHRFGDARGYFMETYNREDLRAAGIEAGFIQDNESFSTYGVVRGLHYQAGSAAQAKLVRVISGEVLDVVVDLRQDSPDFKQVFSTVLSGENHRQLFIPRGFAHGFAVLSETALFTYKCDNPYAPETERGIAFNDPELHIDWRIPAEKMILSEKDLHHPLLRDAEIF